MSSTKTFQAWVELADNARDSECWLDAARFYARALLADGTATAIWVQYGHMLKEADLFDHAVAAYQYAIKSDGTAFEPRLHLGHLLKRLGRTKDAIAAFEDLGRLPDSPPIGQEIAALRAAAEQSVTRACDPIQQFALSAEDKSLFTSLFQEERARPGEALGRPSPAPKQMLNRLFKRRVMSHLQPKAHVVIREGKFHATSEDPQFDVVSRKGRVSTGWYICHVEINANLPLIEPILYVETAPRWSSFQVHRLELEEDGSFKVLFYLDRPPLRMRFDPFTGQGAFSVPRFSIRPLSWGRALREVLRLNPEKARNALMAAFRHRNVHQLGRSLSELVAYPGLSAYEHWRLRHENASIGQSPGQSPCIDLLIMQPYPSKHLDATLQSLEKSPIWNVNSSFEALKEGNNLPFVLVTKAGEYVAEGAAERFIAALTSDPLVDLIYGDDDDLDKAGRRQNPRFKPDWNKDFFLAANFIGNTFVVRRTLLMKALDAGPCHLPGELLQRLVMHAPTPRLLHLPFILSHRRPEVPADATDELAPILWSDEEARSLSAGLQRQIPGISISRSNHGLLHVVWPLPSRPPLVSLIIPTRDHVDLLQSCLLSIRTKTDYPNLQFIVVDNGSTDTAALRYLESLRQEPDVKVLSAPGPFNFSRLNNLAVNSADGAVIGLVNNDIIALEPGWLREMVSHAIRPDVGAVGARLLYQNGLIQHAGMVCGIGLLTGHPHKFRRSDESGYMGRIMATQTLSAVTGACLVVEKAKYLSVGGLDEDHLPVAFNDVDLCLKLGEAGYRTIYTPYATLYHLESISRGFDTTRIKAEAYKREADFMARKWNVRVVNDPFYNPNLTRVREDFSYAD